MSDKTPNSLEPVKKVSVARMSRWPLYAVLLAGLFLLGILVYSVNFAHNQGEEQTATPKVDIKEEERPLLMGEGRGLALMPPAGSPAIAQPERGDARKREPLIVVQGKQEQPDQYRQELENLRRMKAQARLTALSAPLGVMKKSDTSDQFGQQAAIAREEQRRDSSLDVSRDLSAMRENGYDPAADKDKEAFFNRAEKDASWILPHSRTAGQPLELKTGTIIPGLMVTGINSDLPGNIIAQVSQNVFDTATGRQLLIPQGAKLFGVYDSRVIYGQERVLVAWNRLVFPDGSAVTLGAMPGSDMAGNAGYTDQVNNHYLRIFGSAILMSMITGGMSYSMDSLDNSGGGDDDSPTLQDEMGSALAAQLGQATLQLLQKNLNIKPTLEIRPGYQFNVIVTKDIVFERPYKAGR
ncbi:putative conjugal transfer protein TrbI [uncultured delta proteobacterium]|uniref:Putative conjugal transfer protein TrbI n=1 Tax=uncultured delta proteobacterium TaxID=34034 RepID=A0A212K9A5_9DELT|nr:putative conjugal transfer protein TrbI [uncultured delta proteobacterium]